MIRADGDFSEEENLSIQQLLSNPRISDRDKTRVTIAVFKKVRTKLDENGHSIAMRKLAQKILLGDSIKCISDRFIELRIGQFASDYCGF